MGKVKDRFPGFDGAILMPSGQRAFLASGENENVVHLAPRRAYDVVMAEEVSAALVS